VNALLSRLRRGTVVSVLTLVLAGGALVGCGGGGNTSCAADGCTVTFARSGSAEVSVLGVTARLVRVDADIAQIEVAGQTEPLVEVSAKAPLDFVRLAWHIGNRHTDVQFVDGRFRGI